MDHLFHDPNKHQQNIPKPMFDVIEPSIVRAQFVSKRDVSFASYVHQSQSHHNKVAAQKTEQNRTEDSDQISIFDAAKYFSGLEDDHQKEQNSKGGLVKSLATMIIPPRLSSVSSSIDDTGSNYGGQSSNNYNNKYRARSFHATPTASSEASWNSQSGLLANPPGSIGVSIPNTLSPNNSSSTTTSTATPRWPRISTKWFIPRRKCPCSGKKSVQVDERVDSNTPRMVDLRRSTSSNGSATNYITPSWNSPRKISPKNFGTTTTAPVTSLTPNVVTPREPRTSSNFNVSAKSHHHPNSKVVGPLKSFTNHSEMIGTTATTSVTATATATAAANVVSTASTTTNGFTFPILENPPIGVKKMFNVIADPPRESLEVFQPKSHPSPKSRRTSYEDDNALSDGSSDLFEIESFSTTYPCRDSMDDVDEVIVHASSFNSNTMKRLGIVCRNSNSNGNHHNGVDDEEPMTPSVAPTECYAPSEASVDWSVTTAEGFDRGSISNFSVSASEVGMYAAMRRESERNNGNGGGGGGGGGGEDKRSSNKQGGGKGNNGGGGLLNCRCEKAVSVGPGPIKCSAEGGPPIGARHVSGRPTQQPHGVGAHANGRWK